MDVLLLTVLTEIATSYRIRRRSPEMWGFWIHASNAAQFELSLREIADYVKIPGRQHPNANMFKLVERWLRYEKNGNRLFSWTI